MSDRLQEVLDGQTDTLNEAELENNPQTQENLERVQEDSRPVLRPELEEIIVTVMDRQLAGFEDRLATSMQKALDTVLYEYNERLRSLEEDQARILRHLGLEEQ